MSEGGKLRENVPCSQCGAPTWETTGCTRCDEAIDELAREDPAFSEWIERALWVMAKASNPNTANSLSTLEKAELKVIFDTCFGELVDEDSNFTKICTGDGLKKFVFETRDDKVFCKKIVKITGNKKSKKTETPWIEVDLETFFKKEMLLEFFWRAMKSLRGHDENDNEEFEDYCPEQLQSDLLLGRCVHCLMEIKRKKELVQLGSLESFMKACGLKPMVS